jgi:hypothetical protein
MNGTRVYALERRVAKIEKERDVTDAHSTCNQLVSPHS